MSVWVYSMSLAWNTAIETGTFVLNMDKRYLHQEWVRGGFKISQKMNP